MIWNKIRIGKKISTKVPDGLPVTGGGARIRDDITDEYKFPDGIAWSLVYSELFQILNNYVSLQKA